MSQVVVSPHVAALLVAPALRTRPGRAAVPSWMAWMSPVWLTATAHVLPLELTALVFVTGLNLSALVFFAASACRPWHHSPLKPRR